MRSFRLDGDGDSAGIEERRGGASGARRGGLVVGREPGPTAAPGPGLLCGKRPDGTLVTVVDGVVAGYVKLAPVLDLASNRHVLEVRGLAVDPAMHRRGLGRRLMQKAAEVALKRGARRLTLRVLASNRAARALYESCGFEVEGVLRGEFMLDGRYVDDVLMALDLAAASEPAERTADSDPPALGPRRA